MNIVRVYAYIYIYIYMYYTFVHICIYSHRLGIFCYILKFVYVDIIQVSAIDLSRHLSSTGKSLTKCLTIGRTVCIYGRTTAIHPKKGQSQGQ